MKFEKKQWKKLALIGFIFNLLLIASLSYVLSSPNGTFTISKGIYPNSRTYTLYSEGLTYYTKDAFGFIPSWGESSNVSDIFHNIVYSGLSKANVPYLWDKTVYLNAPYGTIYFTEGRFIFDTYPRIPLGSRIIIEGSGASFQPVFTQDLFSGGTQIVSDDPNGCFEAIDYGTLSNGTDVTARTGSYLVLRDLEFYQRAILSLSTSESMKLNGMAMGEIENVIVTSYQDRTGMQGTGLKHITNGLGDLITYKNFQVYGFNTGAYLEVDHLSGINCGFGASRLGLYTALKPNNAWYNLHIFASNKTINLIEPAIGYDVLPNLEIFGFYVEDTGYEQYNFQDGFATNKSAKGKVIIEKMYVSSGASNFWTFSNKTRYEIHKLVQLYTVPAFPSVETPTLTNNTVIQNPNPAMVQVFLGGTGSITSIHLNGISVYWQSPILLCARDTLKIVWSSGTPTWIWTYFDVEHP